MCYNSDMKRFRRKQMPSEVPVIKPTEVSALPVSLIVEPNIKWFEMLTPEQKVKFVRRGKIVLVAVASDYIDHMAIKEGRPDLESRYVTEDDDSVVDAGYLIYDRSDVHDWDIKVDRFSGAYARGDRIAREMTAALLRGYMPDLTITTDDELEEF